ncbi:MAG: ABC transporter ATP-binding protein [Acidobacteria bacterium]|nr:ABC transporter ATP-binding protein [Acidobacteriota bacterium]
MQDAIRVAGLCKTFARRGTGKVTAVDGLSFSVGVGQIFGLLGPNGAGKTTTLRILTTLIRATSGVAEVAGIDVARDPLGVRRRIVVVVQESAAEIFLTVRDNLLTFGRFHGLEGADLRQRVDRALEQFGLVADASRKAMDLSGGFRRRIQVAKALLVKTPVVFLDEFSTGMDPILKRSVMDLLREEARNGRTIVLTTQILGEAEALCDDILIINHGRGIARGDVATIKALSTIDNASLEDVFVELTQAVAPGAVDR